MAKTALLFATKHGQSRKIAEAMTHQLRSHGQEVSLCNVDDLLRAPSACPSFAEQQRAILVAPLYGGRYPKPLRAFLDVHGKALRACPSTLVSVSLSQATVQDRSKSPEERQRAQEGLNQSVEAFVQQTGFKPDQVVHVAGALMYLKYNFFVRWMLKRIARKAGGDTDTSRNHEYTDWSALSAWTSTLLPESEQDSAQASQTNACAGYAHVAVAG